MQLHAAASCQQAPGPTWRPPRASAHLRDRALFKLLPCREAALHAQKANLYKFVRDNAAAYAALPYEPFTRMKRVRFGVPLRVVVSSLPGCVGLRGVVLQHRLVTTKDRELSYYPGLLVTEALHELFSKLYYCPTSLELRALKYREPHEQSARPMLIIGDPTHPGAIINDGVRSGREANCKLQSVSARLLPSILHAKKRGKITVDAQIGAVWALPDQELPAGTELLLDYGDSFWAPSYFLDAHCAVCFARHADRPMDPLIQCEGVAHGAPCNRSRHRLCFASDDVPSLADIDNPQVRFFCPDHFCQSYTPSPGLASQSPPRKLRVADHWTPPPASGHSASSAASATARLCLRDAWTPPPPVKPPAAETPYSGRLHLADAWTPPPPIKLSHTHMFSMSVCPDGASLLSVAEEQLLNARLDGAPSAAQRHIDFGASSYSVRHDRHKQRHHMEEVKVSQPRFGASEPAESDHESEGWQRESESDISTDASRMDVTSCGSSRAAEPVRASSLAEDDDLLGSPSTRFTAMHIRTVKEISAKLGDSYVHNNAPFSTAQVEAMEKVLNMYALDRRRKFWFIPRSVRADTVQAPGGHRRITASISLTSRSVLGSTAADEAMPPESASGLSASVSVSSPSSAITTQRWRNMGADLQRDWAEYRSCCAAPGSTAYSSAGLSANIARTHSSTSIVHFFKARLEFYADSDTREAMTMRVRRLLREQVNNQVPWLGGHLCLSCFRALLGRGRSWMFQALKAMDEQERRKFPAFTGNGALRKSRRAVERDRVVALLRSWSMLVGHSPPNPKTRDLDAIVKFLPVKRMQELAQRLAEFELSEKRLPELVPVKLHTLRAARTWLEKHEKLRLTLGSSIMLMRCADCDMFDNRLKPEYIQAFNRTLEQQMEDRCSKVSHLAAMQRQRDFTMREKDLSMSHPCDSWTLMIDGMDQSKTQLPHRARYNKDLEPLDRMKVHAEGGFCFGAPVPVLGLLNFPDVRKDSNLCIATIERILDVQWQWLEQDRERQQQQNAAQEAAAAAAAVASNDPDLERARRDTARAARTVGADETYPRDGIGHSWPKRLHLTFDNAAGECKNQWMFRFLGLLVLHGIVHHITVSTLLVGHTHDIVDQLFSIWARMLRVHDAETFEKMRAIFRERYMTRIEGLINLMRQRRAQHSSSAEPAAAAAEGTDVQEAFHELMQEPASAALWSAESADMLVDFSSFVKKAFTRADADSHSDLSPYIELQSHCIDVQGWMRHSVDGKLPPLKYIEEAHNFGIEKDAAGDVYLYNKHLCDSTDHKVDGEGRTIHHQYLMQQTGQYTTRALLFRKQHKQDADPFRIPPLVVDTSKLAVTAKKFHAANAMTTAELQQFTAMLTRLDQAQTLQRQACETCADLAAAYCGHGVIHRHKGADSVDKEAARKKSSAKQQAWKAMMAHLYDPAFKEQHHTQQTHQGWWTKWLKRAHEHITPSYVQRCVIMDPQVSNRRYHAHPAHLVSGDGEAPVIDDLGPRVDVSWLMKHGIPRPGQLAVVRSDALLEAFWVAEIVSVRGLDEAARAEVARLEAREAVLTAQSKQQEAAAAAAAAAAVPVGASATSPTTAAPASHRRAAARTHPTEVLFSLKSLELTVVWWDLAPSDYRSTMHFDAGASAAQRASNATFWANKFQQQSTTKHELQQRHDSLIAAGRPLSKPGWLVGMYESCSFINKEHDGKNRLQSTSKQFDDQDELDREPIGGAVLIVWGALADLFNKCKGVPSSRAGKSWRLKEPIHKAVLKDVTQDEESVRGQAGELDELLPPAAAGHRGPAAAQPPAAVPMDVDSDVGHVQAGDHSDSGAERSAAAPAAAAAAATVSTQRSLTQHGRPTRAKRRVRASASGPADSSSQSEQEGFMSPSDRMDEDNELPVRTTPRTTRAAAAADPSASAGADCSRAARRRGKQQRHV